MESIQMVDLHGQYLKIKNEIDLAIQRVLDSAAFVKSPEIKLFQDELANYLGINHVVACANGTDALQIALMALELKPGDEVITPTFTFIATVEVIALLGYKPVLVDVDPYTFLMDIEQVKKSITSRTKAIIPVHLFGQCADMEALMKLSTDYNIPVIEDNAQAIGADFNFRSGKQKKAGAIGQTGCTSFFPSKSLGCYGDGGAMFTENEKLADQLATIANHGMKKRYYHDFIGLNSRLDSLQAAILRVKLKYLDEYNQARQKVAAKYDIAFSKHPNIHIPERVNNSTHIFHQYTLKLENVDRNKLKNFMQDHNIPTSIYYPVPLHLQKAFLFLGYKEGDFPVSEDLCQKVLSLPIHTELNDEQINYICDTLLKFCNQ